MKRQKSQRRSMKQLKGIIRTKLKRKVLIRRVWNRGRTRGKKTKVKKKSIRVEKDMSLCEIPLLPSQ
ncbi:hypothetical protein AHAS_Ahas16G0203500 [Arachis hypogaea]